MAAEKDSSAKELVNLDDLPAGTAHIEVRIKNRYSSGHETIRGIYLGKVGLGSGRTWILISGIRQGGSDYYDTAVDIKDIVQIDYPQPAKKVKL